MPKKNRSMKKRSMHGGGWFDNLFGHSNSQQQQQPGSNWFGGLFGNSNQQQMPGQYGMSSPSSYPNTSSYGMGMTSPSAYGSMGGKKHKRTAKRGGGMVVPYNPGTLWMKSSMYPNAVGGKRRKRTSTRKHK